MWQNVDVGLSKEVYYFVVSQGAQKIPAKVQMKSLIYTILLSKSDFSFALLLVTFEPLDIHCMSLSFQFQFFVYFAIWGIDLGGPLESSKQRLNLLMG